ncbi:disabled homolog 2-like isoform X2 [Erpetoichthys calabaricus]|uniref:disabled homolog 2-like isoform X2 n=1 Tax=Erpetoichthys calabaricus TaxID=27687 RepID=UPI00223485A3|nr:disabled homolog 2-like isoform X2 [Erpetoichthys calabaricus]
MAVKPVQLPLVVPLQTQVPTRIRRMNKKVFEKTPQYLKSRFQGEGVRYKAKLIGIDDVPSGQGDKMCRNSMMKLKGWAATAQSKGRHKQRIWLRVSTSGVRIIDERTGHVEHEHHIQQVTYVMKDRSDPRAFAYVFSHPKGYKLMFIKTANVAESVIIDLQDVTQMQKCTTPEQVPPAMDLFDAEPFPSDHQTSKTSPTSDLSPLFLNENPSLIMGEQQSLDQLLGIVQTGISQNDPWVICNLVTPSISQTTPPLASPGSPDWFSGSSVSSDSWGTPDVWTNTPPESPLSPSGPLPATVPFEAWLRTTNSQPSLVSPQSPTWGIQLQNSTTSVPAGSHFPRMVSPTWMGGTELQSDSYAALCSWQQEENLTSDC